ncbi:MAG: hypothetical protein BGO98_35590 [Myxococcales bacterium 68-20]|nr:hypothetical protein [Myxococcales bacterium]OJY25920.1 MAG: hypothetical protein BGO98_35590 [Myxococcales bacterium 68-20]
MTRSFRATLALSLAVAACGGKEALSPVGTDDGRRAAVARKAKVEPPVAGHMVASVGERTLGPFFARRESGLAAAGLVAWVTVAEGQGRRVVVVPVAPDGTPRGGETIAAHVSVDTTMLVVRPLRGPVPGFLIAWTSLTDRGKSLWAVAVSDNGMPRAKPVEISRTNDDIIWVDVIPTDHGALCMWAEETRGSDANLIAAAVDTDGKVQGVPTRVARGVVGWHALELPGGVGLSTVEAAPADPKARPTEHRLVRDARPGGALSFHRLDAEGREIAPPVTVTTKPIVSGDVEVVRDGSRFVFAWTDRGATEPAVTMAAIDDKNVVEPPRKVAEARGGASLLALTRGPAGVAVMFEAPARRKGETRRVHVARVDKGLVLDRSPLSLEVVGRGQPELAATSTGFAALATTADCERDSAACLNANAVATLFRTDAKGTVVQREPLTFTSDPATLGWGLTCDGDSCFALAASPGPPGTPSRIRTATLRPRTNVAPPPPRPEDPPKDGPHITDITAIASGETVVDIATTRFGEANLVAMLSSKATDGARRSTADEAKTTPFTLSTRIVGDDGTVSTPSIISNKALHVGSVAIAGASSPEDGGAIAWVARENGDPEVHVTRIDKRGRRMNDVQLTTTKGDAADVTITWAGGGWIVAWVDSRDGRGEVYATKVSPDLTRVAREERITKAPGDASDLVALAHGDAVWLAWADSRESPKDGVADIFVSAVKMHDAKRLFEEQRLLPTAAHSRTPRLALGPNGMHVAWIEEAPLGAETPNTSGYGAFWTTLDEVGKPSAKPSRIPLAGEGAATAVAFESRPSLRAVVARSTPEVISLDAVDLVASPPKVSSLLALDGPPSLDIAMVFNDDVLYFNDEGPHALDRRARRARIAWTQQTR